MASAYRTPPFYRTARPGKTRGSVRMTAPSTGSAKSNMCVAPLVHIDGTGNKTVISERAVKRSPKVDL